MQANVSPMFNCLYSKTIYSCFNTNSLQSWLVMSRISNACLSKPLTTQRATVTYGAGKTIGICLITRNRLPIIDAKRQTKLDGFGF